LTPKIWALSEIPLYHQTFAVMGACPPGSLPHNVPFVLRKMDVGYQLVDECFVLGLYGWVKQWKI
jgi:hypothetical protein